MCRGAGGTLRQDVMEGRWGLLQRRPIFMSGGGNGGLGRLFVAGGVDKLRRLEEE